MIILQSNFFNLLIFLSIEYKWRIIDISLFEFQGLGPPRAAEIDSPKKELEEIAHPHDVEELRELGFTSPASLEESTSTSSQVKKSLLKYLE